MKLTAFSAGCGSHARKAESKKQKAEIVNISVILRGREKTRHPEPRRRRRISKLQARRLLRSFVALRRLRMTEDFHSL
jgi:hypothetical protein